MEGIKNEDEGIITFIHLPSSLPLDSSYLSISLSIILFLFYDGYLLLSLSFFFSTSTSLSLLSLKYHIVVFQHEGQYDQEMMGHMTQESIGKNHHEPGSPHHQTSCHSQNLSEIQNLLERAYMGSDQLLDCVVQEVRDREFLTQQVLKESLSLKKKQYQSFEICPRYLMVAVNIYQILVVA